MTGPDRFRATMVEAQNRFAAGLPERLRQIERGWVGLPDGGWEAERFRLLHRQVHNLAGSAGTFGLDAVGEAAMDIERLLTPFLEEGAAPSPDLLLELPDQLDRLGKACAEALADQDVTPEAVVTPRDHRFLELMQQRPLLLVGSDVRSFKELNRQLGFFGYGLQHLPNLAALREMEATVTPLAVILDTAEPALSPAEPVRHAAWKSDVPLILLSPLDTMASRLEAVRAGGVACFAKPVDLSRLVDLLDRLRSTTDPEPCRVLVVDDDTMLAEFMALVLQEEGIDSRALADPMALLQVMETFPPDLILMDLYMPDCSGFELARVLRLKEESANLPIVFLSRESDMERKMAALSLGGDDFLTKPVQPKQLLLTVRNHIQRNRRLRAALTQDILTGTLNHTAIRERLARVVRRHQQAGEPLVYAMLAIDQFKKINGAYGYRTGDLVLKNLARLLRRRLRAQDVCGRYSGDRLSIILPRTDEAAARRLLDGIAHDFSRLEHQHGQISFRATLSWGLALFPECADPFVLGDRAYRELTGVRRP